MRRRFQLLAASAVLLLSACATVLEPGGALTVVPYRIDNAGRILIDVEVAGQGPFEFALDTAASISSVFENLRRELELELVPDTAVTIHGAVASGQFPLVHIENLRIGNEVWSNPRIALLPSDTAATSSIDGVLGIDFLRRYAVGFSTQERVVRLFPTDRISMPTYRGWAAVPLEAISLGERAGALYYFYIGIGGQRILTLFDLGSGANMLNSPAARLLRVPLLRLDNNERLSGAIQTTVVRAKINAREIQTAGVRWRNEAFLVADLRIFSVLNFSDRPLGISGSGLFNQRDFIIDFARSRLLVRTNMAEAAVIRGSDTDG
jgi:hypothetical protein